MKQHIVDEGITCEEEFENRGEQALLSVGGMLMGKIYVPRFQGLEALASKFFLKR